MDEDINAQEMCQSGNMSCFPVNSLLPISAYMSNHSTWYANYFVGHHVRTRTWPGNKAKSTAIYAENAPT
jgi:hypothetical protein